MRIHVEIDQTLESDEVIIRCRQWNDTIAEIEKVITENAGVKSPLVFYKGDVEYYFPLREVLFFETDTNGISAHTRNDIYRIKYRLYELEERLPGYFIRISKSAILNTKKIFAIDRNLSSASVVSFQGTHKQVYVSRRYYKPLKDRLEERG